VSFLIDTNVISELRRGERCDGNVTAWWRSVDEGDLYLSALVVGELRKGIEIVRRKDPAKADALQAWLAAIIAAFADRILPIDNAISEEWGRMSALRTVTVVDGLLAATARVHDITLVTRNAADVIGLGAKVLDPFRPRR